jgi:N-acetylglutamate synthase-like GNAT family acetyltransferase
MSLVRPAGPDDVEAIVRLVNAAYELEAVFVEGERTDAAEISAFVAAGRMFVLEEEGAITGCVYVEVTGERGYFGYLAVDPARQGAGRGRRIIEAVEERCRAAGCTHLDIRVVNLREELLPYYRKLGYIEIGTRPFSDPERLKMPACFLLFTKPLR